MFTLWHSRLSGYVLVLALFSSAVPAFSWQQKGNDDRGVTVTEENNGQTVGVLTDETIVVRLKSQMGTGYGWQILKTDGRRLKLLGEAELENTGDGQPGGVEHQVFRFKGVQPGTTVLELVYVRPWEKNAKPSKTFRLKVRVR